LQIIERVDVLTVGEGREAFARVAAGLLQLGDDVGKGKGAQLLFQLARLLDQLDPRPSRPATGTCNCAASFSSMG